MQKSLKELKLNDLVDFFRSLDKKGQIRLMGIVSGGLFFIFFIFWPAWFTRPVLQTQIQALKGQAEFAKAQVRLEPQLREEKKKYESFTQEIMSRLPTEGELQRFLGILSAIGEKSKVTILSSQPDEQGATKPPKPFDEKYLSVAYVITVEGDYHSLATFVSEVENYSKVLHVDEISIAPQEENLEAHLCEIRISAYSLKQGKK